MTNWLPENLIPALNKLNIETLTEIQEKVIPQALAGRNIAANSPTGTGKTYAYLLPVCAKLSDAPDMAKRVQALVLVPTYELAAQVAAVARELWGLAGMTGSKPVLLVGGAGIDRQVAALKEKPRVVIGSPGRVVELIKLKKLTGHFIKTVVLDECDKLADKNSLAHVKAILSALQKDRQVLLFSATAGCKALEGHIPDLLHISASDKPRKVPESITHIAVNCERREKLPALKSYINREKIEKALLFVRNSKEAEHAAGRLSYYGIDTAYLSADMTGQKRKTAIGRLQSGNIRVLAATDAAARGLDIAGLSYVFNIEPPFTADEYLHRAGRTGRMGAAGSVVTFVSGNEKVRLEKIQKSLNVFITWGGGGKPPPQYQHKGE